MVQQLKVGPENRGAIAKIAESIRRRAGLSRPSFSTMQIIEACFPATVVTGRSLEPDCDELVAVDAHAFRTHKAPHRIFYNRTRSCPEQRYAIAHALGHIIFDGPRKRGQAECHRRELRCDRFADELLVPLAELPMYVGGLRPSTNAVQHERFLDMVDQVASHFHVPSPVIIRRISELHGEI